MLVAENIIAKKVPDSSKKFIIAYGPPASGKSRIIDFVKQEFGLSENSIVEINVDSIVESDPLYQNEIHQCKSGFSQYENVEKVPNELFTKCADIYSKYRKPADAISTDLLKLSSQKGLNIIYEMTGRSIDWLLQNDIPELEKSTFSYDIIIVYYAVRLEELVKRAFGRSKKIGRMIHRDILAQIVTSAEANFIELVSKHNFQSFIIDNNNFDSRIIFKNINNEIFCNVQNGDLDFLPKIKEYVVLKCNITGGISERSKHRIVYYVILFIILYFLTNIMFVSKPENFANIFIKKRK